MKVYVDSSKKLAYFPVAKNASMTFTTLFENLGWATSQFDLLPEDYTVFGHLRDPIERHFKGTAEFILQSRMSHLIDNPEWKKVWSTAVMDIHSYPITWSLAHRADSIHWIPIHKDLDTNKITIDFLKQYNLVLDSITNINEGLPDRSKFYDKLMEVHKKLDAAGTLTYFYDADIVLWNKVIKQYINNPNYRI
jgi:hypothetical protein